jgi:hypothetical protein
MLARIASEVRDTRPAANRGQFLLQKRLISATMQQTAEVPVLAPAAARVFASL